MTFPYQQSINLLKKVTTKQGFLASANDIDNYQRIWARDGVICGLAALLDGNASLIKGMKQTLITLAEHQHELGNIPSNVHFTENGTQLSYGGLTGRVDTVAWFIIGVCQYVYKTGDKDFFEQYRSHIYKGFQLQHSWEYNDGDLMYVPRSGNWADEYPTQGFILYDQLLRLWAIRCFLHFEKNQELQNKHDAILSKVQLNYKKNNTNTTPYHPKAFKRLEKLPYWVASLEPAGYQDQFDAFANALILILNIGDDKDRDELIEYSESLRTELPLRLLPAFWPVIKEEDADWKWLTNNCKYEFRNYPYEFHNGGTWQMVNGFYGVGLVVQNKIIEAKQILQHIELLNKKENWEFYENFNSKTGMPNGVSLCAWSGAGNILLEQTIQKNTLLI